MFGANTDVGKTVIAAGVVRAAALQVGSLTRITFTFGLWTTRVYRVSKALSGSPLFQICLKYGMNRDPRCIVSITVQWR